MISFKQRHFKQDVILMLVRWYVAYALSYRDIEELAMERGLKVDHSTINRWVIHYSPQLEEAFRKRRKRPVGISWRMDETYILRLKESGFTCIVLLIKKANPLISCCLRNTTSLLRGHFSIKPLVRAACLKKSLWIRAAPTRLA